MTHLQTLAWNAMQSRASEQSSKRASKQPYSCNAMLQCNAAWQCHNAVLRCRWVIGDPPQNIGLQCNATQRKQVSKHAGMQAGKQASTSRWVTGDPPAKQAGWLLTVGSTQASTSPCFDLQCNAMQCNAIQCNAMQCNAMQCNAMLRCNAAMQCWKILL